MAAVALIGPDGAGKTTVCRMLERSKVLPVQYLYMGVSTTSSNRTLPTTRLVHRLKNGRRRRMFPRLRGALRLVNRLAEEWYRQLLSWSYQLRGKIVLYDRHFLFDFTGPDVRERNRTLSKRIHVWLLTHAYPRPDLTIFLDAPGRVLHERKGELTPEALEQRRQAHLVQVRRMPNVVRVDATRSPEEVLLEVTELVRTLVEDGKVGAGSREAGAGSREAGEGSRDAGEGSPDAGEGSPDAGEGSPDAGEVACSGS